MKSELWKGLAAIAICGMIIAGCSDDEVPDQQDNKAPVELTNAFAVEEEVNEIGSAVFVKESNDSYELYLFPSGFSYTEEKFEPTSALYYVYFSFTPHQSGELTGEYSGSRNFEPGTFYMAAVRYDCDSHAAPENCPDDGYETYLEPEGKLSISSMAGDNYLITFEFTSYEGAGIEKNIKGHYEGPAQIFEYDDSGEDDDDDSGDGDDDGGGDDGDDDNDGNGGDDTIDLTPSEIAVFIAGTDSKTWHLEKYGISGFTFDAEPCAADDNWVFYADGTFEVDDNESKCDPEDPDQETGTWTLSEDGSTITLSNGENTEEFDIHEVSESEIVLAYQSEEGTLMFYYRISEN